MTLSISGVGYAGAGAYFDLLCEFNGVEHTPNLFELGILYEPDGVIDLVNKLKYNNSKITSYVPVRRFLNVSKFYTDFSWYKPLQVHFYINMQRHLSVILTPYTQVVISTMN